MAARSAVAARRLSLISPVRGWQTEVYAARDVPPDIGGWTRVAGPRRVDEVERIRLDTRGRRFRHYLVWIVALPVGERRASILELTLLQ